MPNAAPCRNSTLRPSACADDEHGRCWRFEQHQTSCPHNWYGHHTDCGAKASLPCCWLIFLIRAAHHDLQRIIRQRPLQCLCFIPRRAHPYVALLIGRQEAINEVRAGGRLGLGAPVALEPGPDARDQMGMAATGRLYTPLAGEIDRRAASQGTRLCSSQPWQSLMSDPHQWSRCRPW